MSHLTNGRPVFNTCGGPNTNCIVVAMNRSMATLISDFIDEVDPEDLEPQLRAFMVSLRHPGDKVPPKQDIGKEPSGSYVMMQGVSGCDVIIYQPDGELVESENSYGGGDYKLRTTDDADVFTLEVE